MHPHRERPVAMSVMSVQSCAAIVLAFTLGAAQISLAAEAPLSFNRDIRPILSDKCFACHGPDKAARKADLRLDDRDAALKSSAFVPGKPEESELVRRIRSADAETLMPPPHAKKPLTDAEKDLLTRWISSGAEYQPHWSFIPVPKLVSVPKTDDPTGWIRNPIDAFVLDHLNQRKWKPAAEATREKWLRRVTFDLTGLPPTIEEIDAFLADQSPGAYETVVDRLLGSPAYGERMANEWLDAARYADTFGYQSDRDTHVWPWRDWVIRAFNENLPYDQFLTWQTAGDLLPNPTRDQQLATAFNRLHRQTNEGGSIEEEFRIAYISDRVATNGTAFLALTFECCRCHSHKYDPLTHEDYYRFAAFFGSIDEHGLYSHFTETAPTPALLLYEGDQEKQHRDLLERIRAKEAELATVREAARARFATASAIPVEVPAAKAAFSFEDLKPAGGYRPVPGKTGQAIEFGGDDAYACKNAGQYGRVTPFTLALWVKPAEHGPRMILAHQSVAAEDSAFRGQSLVLDNGRPVFSMIHFWPGNAIRIEAKQKIPIGEWTHLAVAYDGSSRAAGLRLYINGAPADVEIVRDKLTRDTKHRSEWGDSNGGSVDLALGARFRDSGFRGGAIDEFHVFDRELTPLEIPQLGIFDPPASENARFEHYLRRADEPYRAALTSLQAARHEENELSARVKQIMVMKELPEPRPTHILNRGAYDARGARVEPGTPAAILAMPQGAPKNRLGLAQWMTDDRNPLVARVAVNRLWQICFGRGLVVTSEDFGSQGQPPTHPELLDWLAREFLGSNSERATSPPAPPGGILTPARRPWDTKSLLRAIVLSATYRQSTIPADPKTAQEDPDNQHLARGPKHRLSAEQIRDNALAVSGLLVPRVGGPSVFPYQPAGLWEESGTGKRYYQSTGEGLYRRSMYSFWRRTSPPPTMTTFDATSREFCVARRERTATPLQALVLLNDPQYVEASRVLAETLVRLYPAAPKAATAAIDAKAANSRRIDDAFRRLTSRAPTDKERAILSRLHDQQQTRFAAAPDEAKALLSVGEKKRDESLDAVEVAALTVVVETLFNHDECITKR